MAKAPAGGVVEAWVRAPVQPTEGEAKVAAAVRRVFPDAALERSGWGWEGPARDLDRFRKAIRDQRIPDAARGVLLRGQEGERTRFALGKQAMAAGKVSFAAREGPLGDVQVELRAPSPDVLLAWIDDAAPDTRAWSLEDRGLTERTLRAKESDEAVLDDLEKEFS